MLTSFQYFLPPFLLLKITSRLEFHANYTISLLHLPAVCLGIRLTRFIIYKGIYPQPSIVFCVLPLCFAVWPYSSGHQKIRNRTSLLDMHSTVSSLPFHLPRSVGGVWNAPMGSKPLRSATCELPAFSFSFPVVSFLQLYEPEPETWHLLGNPVKPRAFKQRGLDLPRGHEEVACELLLWRETLWRPGSFL